MENWGLAALLFLLLSVSETKKFHRCELARILKSEGMDRLHGVSLADWVCLANYESRFNTRAVSGINNDGGRNFGIFQINSRWWCSAGTQRPTMGCYTYCKTFMDEYLWDDILCLKRIAKRPVRMNGWPRWRKYCKGKNLSRWTKNCGL